MRYKILLPLLSLVAFSFALHHVIATGQEPPKRPPNVEPSRTPYKIALAGAGVIEPMTENIAMGSHLPGVVAEVFVKVGDTVRLGQPLFRLDDRQLRSELQVRQAMLDAAKASLAKLKSMPRPEEIPISESRVKEMRSNYDDAREQFARAEKGFRTGAVAEDEFSRRKNAVAMNQAQYEKAVAELNLLKQGAWKPDIAVAEAQVELANSQVKQTQTEIERLEVRSSIEGKVLQKNIRPGEYVGVPASPNLLVIGDVRTLHIRVDIDENDIGRFNPKLPGKAFTRGANKREFNVRFVRVEPYVVPKRALTGSGNERVDTRVLQVIYAIENQDDKLYVGQQMDIYFDAGMDSSKANP